MLVGVLRAGALSVHLEGEGEGRGGGRRGRSDSDSKCAVLPFMTGCQQCAVMITTTMMMMRGYSRGTYSLAEDTIIRI